MRLKTVSKMLAVLCFLAGVGLVYVHPFLMSDLCVTSPYPGIAEIDSSEYPVLYWAGRFFSWKESLHSNENVSYKMHVHVESVMMSGLAFTSAGMMFLSLGLNGAKIRLARKRKKLRRKMMV